MKILYVTTISLTMNSFFKPHIQMLVDERHQVDIACNYNDLPLDNLYNELKCGIYQVDFSRSPLLKQNIKAYGQIKKVIENGQYDIVHCHAPNASIITRLVCRRYRKKNGLKVFYTAHGFHFYKGAPLKNWLFYYPVEKLCSRWTDVLITINNEDYALAQKKMKAKRVEYVPGVGIDLERFGSPTVNRETKREELGIPADAVLLLSVGELNENKNHETVIRAIAGMDVYYIIAGKGDLREHLVKVAAEVGMANRVKMLGFRKDTNDLYSVSDIFVLPSYREGLSVALMEAMASGLPVVCAKIRGNVDLIDEGGGVFFDPYSEEECKDAIQQVMDCDYKELGAYNQQKIKPFALNSVLKEMYGLYEKVKAL